MIELRHVLPVPGPVWGPQPMRADGDRAAPWRGWGRGWGAGLARCRQTAQQALRHSGDWCALPADQRTAAPDSARRAAALAALRRRLRRDGLAPAAVAQALGMVSACAAETLGWTPRPTQLLAAAALLDSRMAEMATGEGKTLAIALAAAVAALAGVPVHVVTANAYLAERDAARLAPLYAALGLRATALDETGDGAAATDAGDATARRRAAYGHDIVYATAKALAFDFLRDRLAQAGASTLELTAAALGGVAAPAPLMRGLCMALLDEADSILLDEAEVPLILSRSTPHAARRAFLWQALALARGLDAGRDFQLSTADRCATLHPAGETRLAAAAAGLGGPWSRPRYRREAVQVALAALHLFHRDQHYVVRAGAIELLDEVTGRIATGRVWSRGLHTAVALKEGLRAPDETETLAQTSFQRFFQRYWRLCGISGTLWEARAELRAVYGTGVVRVPLHRPCRRATLPPRLFGDAATLFAAAAARAQALQAAGRPVLLGTDSVADSLLLSAQLAKRGVPHAVLNALQHADEAAIVAAAGRAGQVTVATRMAGRGTDIELDAAAHAAGGLHVLSCQHNPSRRLDRQLAGRAGRHGDPGSTEAWHLQRTSAQVPAAPSDTVSRWQTTLKQCATQHAAACALRWFQWREERRRAAARRQLLAQDQHWARRLSFAGRED